MFKLFSIALFLISIKTTVSAQINEQYVVASSTATMRGGEGETLLSVATISEYDVVQVLKTNANGWWLVAGRILRNARFCTFSIFKERTQ